MLTLSTVVNKQVAVIQVRGGQVLNSAKAE